MDGVRSRSVPAHAYPCDGHRRQMWVGVLFVVLSPLVLVPGADILGFELPPFLQWGLALFGLVLGLRLLTWAMQRARSDEPAVALVGRQLHLHAHPGRRITLRREDVLGVEPVQALEGFGHRFAHGSHGFRIITSARGIRAMNLVIGDRMVADPIDEVRATVTRFATTRASDEPPTSV